MSQPLREGTPPGSGLATASLHRAIHDLRGPLNTVAILAEVVRQKGQVAAEAAKIAKAIAGLGTMLDQLRDVADTLTVQRDALDLTAHLRKACSRFVGADSMRLGAAPDARVTVLGDGERLDRLLDTLLACATAALPDGGEVTFEALADGLSVRTHGARVDAPAPRMIGHLTATPPGGGADWFRLSCQVEGLGAELRVEHDATTLRAELHFPTP